MGIWCAEKNVFVEIFWSSELHVQKILRALESIGFVFRVHEKIWNQRFLELNQYNGNFGDCLVPKKFPSNPVLAKWVEMQRSQYNYLHDGRPSHLSPERIQLLGEVGFVWNVRYTIIRRTWKCKNWLNPMKSIVTATFQIRKNRQLATWIRKQKCSNRWWTSGFVKGWRCQRHARSILWTRRWCIEEQVKRT